MDSKKFIQLVEENKRALERKEAPLKWEQKLEAAAKARGDAQTKEKKSKRAKRRSDSDSKSDSSDGGIKRRRRSHKKHRKNVHCDSGDHDRKKKKRSEKRSKRLSPGSSDDNNDEYDSSSEEDRRKKRRIRKLKHHDSGSDSESLVSFADDDNEIVKRSHAKHHKHRRVSVSSTSDSSCGEIDCRIRKRSHTNAINDIKGRGLVLQSHRVMKLFMHPEGKAMQPIIHIIDDQVMRDLIKGACHYETHQIIKVISITSSPLIIIITFIDNNHILMRGNICIIRQN